jgi:peptidoglycan hydrolase CwlO-like protein
MDLTSEINSLNELCKKFESTIESKDSQIESLTAQLNADKVEFEIFKNNSKTEFIKEI